VAGWILFAYRLTRNCHRSCVYDSRGSGPIICNIICIICYAKNISISSLLLITICLRNIRGRPYNFQCFFATNIIILWRLWVSKTFRHNSFSPVLFNWFRLIVLITWTIFIHTCFLPLWLQVNYRLFIWTLILITHLMNYWRIFSIFRLESTWPFCEMIF